ncbi:hypothetical protein GCM10009801_23550 [Streptomyces albiaxialis]|uniref:FXSXX-COOH protein n=1 Tax=Streptomyces albiaxialis TaxID=329523 RepID=A0ABN2VTA5_9ACTN
MLHQRDESSAGGSGSGSPAAPPLPDLTGVDLHTLYHLDDAVVSAAVRHALSRPRQFAESWKCAPGTESFGTR